jgi:peptidoglycan/xylan/chitin deacetylase (PgdA/CDA1 family)
MVVRMMAVDGPSPTPAARPGIGIPLPGEPDERPTPVPATPPPTRTPSPTATLPALASPTAVAPTATEAPAAPPVERVPVVGERARVPILMYHYIRVAPNPADRIGVDLSVAPEMFVAQMDYLQREGYQTVTLAQLRRAIRGEEGLPPRPVVLTFDDGYEDFYHVAWPVLREHGFSSTLFVVTGLVGQPGYVTRAMVRELSDSGLVEIGSHTVSHPDLTTVSPDRLQREVRLSKRHLEEWTEQPVTSFCYPAGRSHAGVVAAVRAAGYDVAVTTRSGSDHAAATALEWQRQRLSGPGSVEGLVKALTE